MKFSKDDIQKIIFEKNDIGTGVDAGYNISLDIKVFNKYTKENEIIREPILTFDSVSVNSGRYFSFRDGMTNKTLGIFQYGSKEVILDLDPKVKNNWGILFEKFSTYPNHKGLSSKCMSHVVDFIQTKLLHVAEEENLVSSEIVVVCRGPFIINDKIHIFHAGNNILEAKDGADFESLYSDENIASAEVKSKDVIKWLNLIKEIPLNKQSKSTWYRTLALSFSIYMRMIMFDCGVKSIPYVILIGPPGQGKSTIYIEFLINAIHSIESTKTHEYFEGSSIRLRDILCGTTRPQVIDEVPKIENPRLISILKNGSTNKYGAMLPRSKKDLTKVAPINLVRGIFIGTNDLSINDVAFRDRMLEINIPSGHKECHKDLTYDEMVFLKETGLMVGQILDEIILGMDIEEIKKVIESNKDKKNPRFGDKKSFIQIGIDIIKRIYKKYGVEYDKEMEECAMDIQPTTETSIVDTQNEKMLSAFYKTLLDTRYVCKGESISAIEMTRILKENIDSSNIYAKAIMFFGDYGIYFKKTSTDFGIILGGMVYKSVINKVLYDIQISSMKQLSEKLQSAGLKNKFFSTKEEGKNKVIACHLKGDKSSVILVAAEDIGDVESVEKEQN